MRITIAALWSSSMRATASSIVEKGRMMTSDTSDESCTQMSAHLPSYRNQTRFKCSIARVRIGHTRKNGASSSLSLILQNASNALVALSSASLNSQQTQCAASFSDAELIPKYTINLVL